MEQEKRRKDGRDVHHAKELQSWPGRCAPGRLACLLLRFGLRVRDCLSWPGRVCSSGLYVRACVGDWCVGELGVTFFFFLSLTVT